MAAAPQKPASCTEKRPRLRYVDGMRGLAALYVVLYHAAGDVPPPAPALRFIAWFLQFGHYAVGVFIVLSGLCLMLPVARSLTGTIEGGLRAYAVRRMRRILPAYYVVLLFAVAAVAIVRTRYSAATGEEADVLRLTPSTLVSHLLLFHNLRASWATAFDPPMWSVAAECQIYVLFPLLLVPLWRFAGSLGAIATAFALGLAPHFLLPAANNLDWTFPWYLGLFALGMAAASISFSSRRAEIRLRSIAPWSTLAHLLTGLFAAVAIREAGAPIARLWLPDLLLGCAVSALLIQMATRTELPPGAVHYVRGSKLSTGPSGDRGWRLLARLLESRPSALLGACSYSLYLLHAPILWTLTCLLDALHTPADAAFVLRLALGTPLSVGLSYASFVLVERRFLRTVYS